MCVTQRAGALAQPSFGQQMNVECVESLIAVRTHTCVAESREPLLSLC